MDFRHGQIITSRAGHDTGTLYCILEIDGDFLLLSDGKLRKTDRPKRKRRKHVQWVGKSGKPVMIRFREGGQPPTDSELRSALAVIRDELSSVQGGNTLGKKRHD